MDEDEEDIKKMTEFINTQKSGLQTNFQLDYQDFVTFDQDCDDDLLINSELDAVYAELTEIPSTTLTEDEQNIIDSCPDPDLKRLLALNRKKNMQLIKLHKKIQQILVQCESAMEKQNCIIKSLPPKQAHQHTNIWKLGAPYFKDKRFFQSPANDDTVRKRHNNELSVYEMTKSHKWIPVGFDRLISAVKCNYNINRQNDVVRKMNAFKPNDGDEESEQMLDLKRQLVQLKSNDDEIPPWNSNKFINWYTVSEMFLKGRQTPLECEAVWHMLVHPDINNSKWSEAESQKLEAVAKNYNFQDWEAIAEELDNNRTAFTTCLHYFSKLSSRFVQTKFTTEEDNLLMEAIEQHKIGNFIPWNRVVCHFENRSKQQIYHRYSYYLSWKNVKRGKFCEAEDILLIILVNKFGRNFSKCAQHIPGRTPMQLKNRYYSNLQKQIKKGTFTTDEDNAILGHVEKFGTKKWAYLTETLNRSNAQIRQRYKCIKTFLANNSDANIGDMPKRNRIFELNDKYSFMHCIADQYKGVNFVPTIEMIEDSLKEQVDLDDPTAANLPPNANVRNVDAALIDFFKSSKEIGRTDKKILTEEILTEAAGNVAQVLSVLQARLDVPNDLKCNTELDNIDLEILERLSQRPEAPLAMERLVAPTTNTLVGLRALIIKNKEYKAKWKNLRSSRSGTSIERELFSQRFDKLFEWSAVLSLEKPNGGATAELLKRKIQADESTTSKKSKLVSDDDAVSLPDKSELVQNADAVYEDDLEDVKNLDLILKSMQSTRNLGDLFRPKVSAHLT